jgi:hypothetical protein
VDFCCKILSLASSASPFLQPQYQPVLSSLLVDALRWFEPMIGIVKLKVGG